ncbi:MAG: TasA family protein [Clostridium sp.]|uniref:TasA family protein n=1 Tax=Clostridium sp. TaxID=1506 RepID=UPI003D6D98FD
MKLNKKILIAFLLGGAIVIAAESGVGSYAYFTAKAESNKNVITAGTFKFGEKEIDQAVGQMIDFKNASPGVIENMKNFEVKNNGSLDMGVKVTINVKAVDGNGKEFNIKDNKLKIKSNVLLGEINYFPTNPDFISIAEFKQWIEKTIDSHTLKVNETFKIAGSVKLDETAGNEYQNAKIELEIILDAKQIIDSAEYRK